MIIKLIVIKNRYYFNGKDLDEYIDLIILILPWELAIYIKHQSIYCCDLPTLI
jgi:hypothetical protein